MSNKKKAIAGNLVDSSNNKQDGESSQKQKEVKPTEERDANVVEDKDNSQKRENTRSTIAIIYVSAFLGIIAVSLIACWWVGSSVADQKDLLVAISGVLSGPLGFIVGYYFKASIE